MLADDVQRSVRLKLRLRANLRCGGRSFFELLDAKAERLVLAAFDGKLAQGRLGLFGVGADDGLQVLLRARVSWLDQAEISDKPANQRY